MIVSVIWKPILSTGFSDVIGSWKIIAISLPRIRRISFFDVLRRSLPWKSASPRTMRPGGCGISPRMDIVLTLLPDPDSPTIPRVSPGKRS